MQWWSVKKQDSTELERYICLFILNCPASIEKKEKDGTYEDGKKNYKKIYQPVSARGCSFKSREITGHLLLTILSQIKRSLTQQGAYEVIGPCESVEVKTQEILDSSSLSDAEFDLMVFCKRSDMPETEAVFYYIRNAFAHGSFEIRGTGNSRTCYLESQKDGKIKAQMRLKKTTLDEFSDLLKMTPAQVGALQKRRKK